MDREQGQEPLTVQETINQTYSLRMKKEDLDYIRAVLKRKSVSTSAVVTKTRRPAQGESRADQGRA